MSDEDTGPVLPGEGDSDYERYLRTDELLALQKPPEEQAHRDELLFQTVHQFQLARSLLDASSQFHRAAVTHPAGGALEGRVGFRPATRLL